MVFSEEIVITFINYITLFSTRDMGITALCATQVDADPIRRDQKHCLPLSDAFCQHFCGRNSAFGDTHFFVGTVAEAQSLRSFPNTQQSSELNMCTSHCSVCSCAGLPFYYYCFNGTSHKTSLISSLSAYKNQSVFYYLLPSIKKSLLPMILHRIHGRLPCTTRAATCRIQQHNESNKADTWLWTYWGTRASPCEATSSSSCSEV